MQWNAGEMHVKLNESYKIECLHNNIFLERTKYVEIDYHFICPCLLQVALLLHSVS